MKSTWGKVRRRQVLTECLPEHAVTDKRVCKADSLGAKCPFHHQSSLCEQKKCDVLVQKNSAISGQGHSKKDH